MGLSDIEISLNGNGTIVNVAGIVKDVRYNHPNGYIALALNLLELDETNQIIGNIGLQYLKLPFHPEHNLGENCDLPFQTKFIYLGASSSERRLKVRSLAHYASGELSGDI